eukprot:29684-Pelagococcus_subviridis.AAC.4
MPNRGSFSNVRPEPSNDDFHAVILALNVCPQSYRVSPAGCDHSHDGSQSLVHPRYQSNPGRAFPHGANRTGWSNCKRRRAREKKSSVS